MSKNLNKKNNKKGFINFNKAHTKKKNLNETNVIA